MDGKLAVAVRRVRAYSNEQPKEGRLIPGDKPGARSVLLLRETLDQSGFQFAPDLLGST
jgi:hypothetical protein